MYVIAFVCGTTCTVAQSIVPATVIGRERQQLSGLGMQVSCVFVYLLACEFTLASGCYVHTCMYMNMYVQ